MERKLLLPEPHGGFSVQAMEEVKWTLQQKVYEIDHKCDERGTIDLY